MIELICLLDSKKADKLGMDAITIEGKIMVDFKEIECFRESFDEDGEAEPFIYIEMKSGGFHCIKKTFEDFKILYQSQQLEK